MRVRNKSLFFIILLILMTMVFGGNQIKTKTEAGKFLLKADEAGNKDYTHMLTLERGEPLTQEFTVGKKNLEGVILNFNLGQENADFSVSLSDTDGKTVQAWNHISGADINQKGVLYLFLEEGLSDIEGQTYTLTITDLVGGLQVQAIAQTDPSKMISGMQGEAFNVRLIYAKLNAAFVLGIFLALVLLVNAVLFFLFYKKKISYVKSFILLYAILGMGYFCLIPASMVPDESIHYFRAFEIADGNMISDIPGDDGNAAYLISYPEEWQFNHKMSQYEVMENADYLENAKNDAGRAFNATAFYAPITYLPQSLGIFTARLFTGRVLALFLSGRFVNFVAIGAVLAAAVYFMPYGKKYLIMIALLPMNLHESISLSPDGMVVALTCFMVAFVLYLRERGRTVRLNKKELLVLYVLAVFISLYKSIYMPFCVLYFLIPREQFGTKKQYRMHVGAMMALVLGISLVWLKISSRYLIMFQAGVDATKQVSYILHHPISYIGVMINTAITSAEYWFETMMGSLMGWLNIEINVFILYIFAVIVILSIARDFYKKEKNDRGMVFNMGFILVVIVLLTFTSLYVEWTAVQAGEILGVQGRYFIPLLLPLILCLIGRKKEENEFGGTQKRELLLICNINLCVLVSLATYFLP